MDRGNSVLGAITFALFSGAREIEGNKKGLEDLVSNGKNNLRVVFQFVQNNNRYRITRTYDKIKAKSNILLDKNDDGGWSYKIRDVAIASFTVY